MVFISADDYIIYRTVFTGVNAGDTCSSSITDSKQCVDNAQCTQSNSQHLCQCGGAYYNNNGACADRTYSRGAIIVRAANFAQLRHPGSQVLLGSSLSLDYCPASDDVFVRTVKNSMAMCQYVTWTCVTDITHRVTTPARRTYTCEKFM